MAGMNCDITDSKFINSFGIMIFKTTCIEVHTDNIKCKIEYKLTNRNLNKLRSK